MRLRQNNLDIVYDGLCMALIKKRDGENSWKLLVVLPTSQETSFEFHVIITKGLKYTVHHLSFVTEQPSICHTETHAR